MARRKTTSRKTTAARRKTTARRRASPARRKTTRRKTTTRRRKAPARRKTTTRRRRTTRRKSPTTRRRTTRRKTVSRRKPTTRRRKTTRRKPATRRRKTTRRKSTTRRRKPTTRRRKSTTRRRRSPARRKSTTRRRRSAARRTVSRRRSARRMKLRMPKLGGFGKYVRKHLDLSAILGVVGGLALPTLAVAAYQKLNLGSYLARVPVIGDTLLMNPYGQAALGVLVSAGITYGAASMGLMSESAALSANMIALGVFAATALARTSDMAAKYLPYNVTLDGMHSMAGYRGGYLGYLGEATMDAEMLPAPVEDQLFGVGSAPKFNVF